MTTVKGAGSTTGALPNWRGTKSCGSLVYPEHGGCSPRLPDRRTCLPPRVSYRGRGGMGD